MFLKTLVLLLCVTKVILAESWRKPGCHRMVQSSMAPRIHIFPGSNRKVYIYDFVFAKVVQRGVNETKSSHTKTISIPDCVEFKITTNACSGYCESWSVPSIMLGFKRHPVTSLGQCCNIMESEDIPVKVLCLDGERNLIFKSAVTCDCYHCQKE